MIPLSSRYNLLDEEIVNKWLSSLDVSQSTRSAYDAGLRSWCAFVGERDMDFDEASPSDVVEYKRHLLEDRELSAATVSLYLNALRSFYRHAEADGLENVAKGIHGARSPKGFRKSVLSVKQALALLSLHADPGCEREARDGAIISLMLHTGLRDVEVTRADLGDLSSTDGVETLRVRGKGRDDTDEFVVLTSHASDSLAAYLSYRQNLTTSSPLFSSVSRRNPDGRLTTRSVSRIVKDSLRAIGIDDPRYTAHSLRHSAITFALLGGARIEDASAMARHRDISTTMIYAHHVRRIDDAAEGDIAAYLGTDD